MLWIAGFLKAVPARAIVIGAVILAALIFYEGIPFFYEGRVGKAYNRGQMQERIAWQETQRREELARLRERREAESELEKISAEFIQRELELSKDNAELQKKLADAFVGRDDNACIPAHLMQ